MADRIDHGHDGQTERQSDAEEADPEVGKARRDHRAAAAAENQPEGADELGQSLLHIAHMTLSSRRRSWAPPARSDVISRSAYDNPSSHTASGGCDGLDEMARRSEEHTSELQSLMRISYAVFCLKKKKTQPETPTCIKTNYKECT